MALAPNAVMQFVRYSAEESGIRFHFVCANPGGGEPSDYDVLIEEQALVQATTVPQITALVSAALIRKYRTSTKYAALLDPLIGGEIVI